MIHIRDDEKIISIYRRHKFIILMEIFPLVFFALAIVLTAIYLYFILPSEFESVFPLVLLITTLFLHIFWIVSFIAIADYYLDIWILTNKRIVTIEQKNLFSRIVAEFELSKIQEISTDIHGFIPTLLDYGNVKVRTASENADFVFKQVDSPNAVKDAITKAQMEDKKQINE